MEEFNYISEEDNDEEFIIDYNKLQDELDNNLKNIYEDIIIPYINNIMEKEILHKLDDFSFNKFISFFTKNSNYHKFLQKKTRIN